MKVYQLSPKTHGGPFLGTKFDFISENMKGFLCKKTRMVFSFVKITKCVFFTNGKPFIFLQRKTTTFIFYKGNRIWSPKMHLHGFSLIIDRPSFSFFFTRIFFAAKFMYGSLRENFRNARWGAYYALVLACMFFVSLDYCLLYTATSGRGFCFCCKLSTIRL